MSKILTYVAGFAMASVLLSAIASALTGSAIITIAVMLLAGWVLFSPNGRQAALRTIGRVMSRTGVGVSTASAPGTGVAAPASTSVPTASVPSAAAPSIDLSRVPDRELEAESFHRAFGDLSNCSPRLKFVDDAALEYEIRRRMTITP